MWTYDARHRARLVSLVTRVGGPRQDPSQESHSRTTSLPRLCWPTMTGPPHHQRARQAAATVTRSMWTNPRPARRGRLGARRGGHLPEERSVVTALPRSPVPKNPTTAGTQIKRGSVVGTLTDWLSSTASHQVRTIHLWFYFLAIESAKLNTSTILFLPSTGVALRNEWIMLVNYKFMYMYGMYLSHN